MVQRKVFPVDHRCEIVLTVEEMRDETWAVVASIKHLTGDAEQFTDLPVPSERFATAEEAEVFGLRMAREWIDANMPRAA